MDRPIRIFTRVAFVVLFCDLVSKELAAVTLGDTTALTAASVGALRLGLVMNEGAAGGIWLGEHTRLLNILSMALAACVAAAALRQLSVVHRVAPLALGLIVGGALGNTISLIVRPGVIDFLAFDIGNGSHVVINLADVAAFAGVCALMPVGLAIASQLMASRRRVVPRGAWAVAPKARRVLTDREVPLALASELRVAAEPAGPQSSTEPLARVEEPRPEV